MPQLVINIGDLGLTSTWTGTKYWDNVEMVYKYSYTTPTDPSQTLYFDISALPPGSQISSAFLSMETPSPYSGAAVRTVDGTYFYSPRDVLSKIQALGGVYTAPLPFTFRFRAGGNTGGAGSKSSMQSFLGITLTIDYVAAASTGSLNKSECNIGETIRLQNIVVQDGSYTHKAVWQLLGAGTVTQDLGANPGFKDFTLPAAWYDLLPSTTYGQASVRLETYSAGVLLALNTYYFTAVVPAAIKPSIAGFAAAHYSDSVPAVPGAWGKYVKSKSKATLNASVTAGAGSGIKAVRVECAALGYVGTALPFTLPTALPIAGTFTFTLTITDSRDRVATATVNITVQDYGPPVLSGVSFARAVSDGGAVSSNGTHIRGVATFSGYTLGGSNPVTAKAYYRQSGSANWYPVGGKDVVSGTPFWMGSGTIAPENTYEVKVEAYDYFGTTPISTTIPTAVRFWDFRADRAALGRYASNANEFALPDLWHMRYRGQLLDDRYLSKNGGGAVNGRLTILCGNYNADAGTRFTSSALEIQENGLVQTAQTHIAYAPSIAFHWGGTAAGTLVMKSSGEFVFLSQAGAPQVLRTGGLTTEGSGKYCTVGPQNAGFCHYMTDAENGHYFNKNAYVNGEIYAGASYAQKVYHRGNITRGWGAPSSAELDGHIYHQFV